MEIILYLCNAKGRKGYKEECKGLKRQKPRKSSSNAKTNVR